MACRRKVPPFVCNWLFLLVLTVQLFVVCYTAEDLPTTSDIKKDSIKPKKVILEKKSDVKNLKSKSASSPGSALLVESATPLYINDTEWTDTIWTKPFLNNTVIENKTLEVEDYTLEDQKYFITKVITDAKKAKSLWVDISTLPKHQTFTHEVLSDSHRRAASITLPFKFPFYGQAVSRATIATGGFLYMGEMVHTWLAATQYIAPLMANFDTRNSTQSNVFYGWNTTLFVIQWERVMLQEKPDAQFTFQCLLYSNGNIAFVYKDIPIAVDDIPDSGHPVKIGVSDAYFMTRSQVYVRRKTIYEYHKLDIINSTSKRIGNNTAIFLQAKPTCITLTSCQACISQREKIGFKCNWCSAVNRCSDGFDRLRQEWITKHCDQLSIQQDEHMCPVTNQTSSTVSSTTDSSVISGSLEDTNSTSNLPVTNLNQPENTTVAHLEYKDEPKTASSAKKAHTHSGIALSLFLLLSIVSGLGLWAFYAYRNPTSASGQLLIRWRPSTWRWKSTEARYTAASIHM